MNKIVIDKDKILSLENENLILDSQCNNINLEIKGNVVINEIIDTNKFINLKIKMYDNSNLIYNRYVHKKTGNLNLYVETLNNTNLTFNNSLYLDDLYEININNNILGNNNICNYNIKAYNILNGKIDAKGILDVKSNTLNNDLTENFRIITNNNEKNHVFPALVINSSDVSANHYTTISPISQDELFYLSTKGIDKNSSKLILRNSLLLKNFNDNLMIESIKKLLEKE